MPFYLPHPVISGAKCTKECIANLSLIQNHLEPIFAPISPPRKKVDKIPPGTSASAEDQWENVCCEDAKEEGHTQKYRRCRRVRKFSIRDHFGHNVGISNVEKVAQEIGALIAMRNNDWLSQVVDV